MIGRNATVGLALLCALLFSAFAVQSAAAQVGVHATNTTAFTCVKVGVNEGDFSDEHCDEKVGAEKGSFAHQEFPKSKDTTEIEITNDKTTPDTTGAESATLTSTHLGVSVEITCATVKSEGKNWIQNVEKEGKHTVEGTAKVLFTKCEVKKPLNCTTTNIETIASFKGVEGLKFGAETKAMGLEFVEDGGDFLKFSFSGEKCTFKGQTFPLKGSTIATGKPNPGQATKHSGATWMFESANEMDTLKFSTSNADFKGTFTPKMAGGGNPITLTTVT